jgi:4-hydroxy-tetrahydrodipicolinate synthase
MNLRNQLSGVGVAIVTPFRRDLSIDYKALERLIDFLIENNVNYIVTQGTTGETPTLSAEEKQELLSFTFAYVGERVPIVVGVGGNDTRAVCRQLEQWPLEKATAVLSAAPYYNKPSQEGLYQHYLQVAAASPRPVILYNVPGRTGRNMEPETTLRLAAVTNIAGIKEAGNSVQQCMSLLRDRPADFLIVSGDDDLVLAELAGGIDGVISVVANCYPRTFSRMVAAGLEGDFATARKINFELMEVYRLLFAENNPAGAKAFLHQMGFVENCLRLPLVPLSESLQEEVGALLRKYPTP